MNDESADFDVIILGAGAAGLSAGRVIEAAGLAFVILEARQRVGGRAFTQIVEGFALDHGCAWLHSGDRNPFTRVAGELGFSVDRSPTRWGAQDFDPSFSDEDRRGARAASERFFASVEIADLSGGDFAAARLLEPGNRFNAIVEAQCAYINGDGPDKVSVLDWRRYEDSGVNWRLERGYGALIAAFGAGLPVRLGAQATRVDHSGVRIVVETPRGALSARALIVTLPASLIALEALSFHPALPDKSAAAAGLPLGAANKLTLAGDPAELPPEGHFLGEPFAGRTGAWQTRPFGLPLIEGYFGGALARELEAGGESAFLDFARDELARFFGARFAQRLRVVGATAWTGDPFSRGAYSYASPGCADNRARLAAPVDGRIFFAGEACSIGSFSTAHGAYETGRAAARGAIAALKAKGAPRP